MNGEAKRESSRAESLLERIANLGGQTATMRDSTHRLATLLGAESSEDKKGLRDTPRPDDFISMLEKGIEIIEDNITETRDALGSIANTYRVRGLEKSEPQPSNC